MAVLSKFACSIIILPRCAMSSRLRPPAVYTIFTCPSWDTGCQVT